jgi:hypothetical protein
MNWHKYSKKNHPPSDTKVLVLLNGKHYAVSYYFEDSYGKWFSSDWNIWDKTYTGYVTHWSHLPRLPGGLIIKIAKFNMKDEYYGPWFTCPYCDNKEIINNAKFCDQCGEEITPEEIGEDKI